MRFEPERKLTPEDERAVLRALEENLSRSSVRPNPWALAGRAEGLGLGALQIRHQSVLPWGEIRLNPYTRRGTEPRQGRADSK